MAIKQVALSDLWTRMLADLDRFNRTGAVEYKDYAYRFYYEYKKRGGSRQIEQFEKEYKNAN